MFEVTVNQEKQKYRSKPTMNVDISGSSASIPKPLTYDYMPEGYPKKSGWSIVWDGNTEGKVAAVGAQLYKISDMMPTYDDLRSATLTPIGLPGDPAAVSDLGMTENKVSDNITEFVIGRNLVHLYVISENNASVEGVTFPKKGTYISYDAEHFKLGVGSGVITPMSTDFMPKNLNVVFRGDLGHAPTSCNVTYNELRDWVERDIPVFAVFITANAKFNITSITLLTDSLAFVYYLKNSTSKSFAYKSNGTFVIQPE